MVYSLFNKVVLEKAVHKSFPSIILHDWWIFAVCMALGGNYKYEDTPLLLYRQHQNNVVGSDKGGLKKKIHSIFYPRNKHLTSQLSQALYENFKDELSVSDKKLLYICANYKKSIFERLKLLVFFKKLRSHHNYKDIRVFISIIKGTL